MHTRVRIWDPAAGKLVVEWREKLSTTRQVAFSPDGSRVILADEQQHTQLRDAATGKLLASGPGRPCFFGGPGAPFSPDGRFLLAAAEQGLDRTPVILVQDVQAAGPRSRCASA